MSDIMLRIVLPKQPSTKNRAIVLRKSGQFYAVHFEDLDVPPEEKDRYFWGHYFEKLPDALKDFGDRLQLDLYTYQTIIEQRR